MAIAQFKTKRVGNEIIVTQFFDWQRINVKEKEENEMMDLATELFSDDVIIKPVKEQKLEKEKVSLTDVQKYDRRQSSIQRARQKIFDLVKCNFKAYRLKNSGEYKTNDIFLTLTYGGRDEQGDMLLINDRKRVYKDFIEFKRRLKRYIKNVLEIENKFGYIGVVERQSRDGVDNMGNMHLHLVMFDFPYIEQSVLLKMWRQVIDDGKGTKGGVNIQSIKNEYVAQYLAKYLEFDMQDLNCGARLFISSLGLIQPTITTYRSFEDVKRSLKGYKMITSYEYNHDYLGYVLVIKYIIDESYVDVSTDEFEDCLVIDMEGNLVHGRRFITPEMKRKRATQTEEEILKDKAIEFQLKMEESLKIKRMIEGKNE